MKTELGWDRFKSFIALQLDADCPPGLAANHLAHVFVELVRDRETRDLVLIACDLEEIARRHPRR